MRTIGLIGGMSWESSAQYYRIINTAIRQRLGGLHSAELLMYSVNFEIMERLQHENRWDEAGNLLAQVARRLQVAGAECVLLCTNTMHRVASQVEQATALPLLHIADPTGIEAVRLGIRRVGLLGTQFTMEQDFYRDRLKQKHGLTVLIPDANERARIHRIIYDELCKGRLEDSSRDYYRDVIGQLTSRGAEAVILGCTEIMLLLNSADCAVPLIDTTTLHALSAVDFALSDASAHDGDALSHAEDHSYLRVSSTPWPGPSDVLVNRSVQLWDAPLGTIADIPADGSLFQESSSTQVHEIANGRRLPAPATATCGTVHVLWDGALGNPGCLLLPGLKPVNPVASPISRD